jgi:molybdopterin-binding protein
MKIGVRNQLIGEVTKIAKDGVMTLVYVKIPAESMMASVFTVDSLNDLGIKEGDKVKVVAKAINVILMRE